MSDICGAAQTQRTAGALDEQKAPTIEITHPSEYIREEMDARDWGIPSMARAMGGDYDIQGLALGMYLSIGPINPGLRLGAMADDIARAFGTSAELWQNLEKSWLRARAQEAE